MKWNVARLLSGLGCLVLMATSFGCGGASEGPERFAVSGTVTFKGESVPSGTIFFEPNAAKGNNGPQGFAKIVDGRYDTRESGKGTVGGPHQVRIEGAQQTEQGQPPRPLFQDYRTDIDLPRDDATHDFEVPAAAGKNVVIPKDPV